MRAVAFHQASQTRNVLAAAFAIALSVMLMSAAQAQTVQQRLQAKGTASTVNPGERRSATATAQVILDWLVANSELPVTRVAPHIELVSPYAIAALRYGQRPGAVVFEDHKSDLPAQYHLMSLYHEATRTIFLTDSWTGSSAAETSILVRELVRYIQDYEQIGYPCAQSRDRVALVAQQKWLALSETNLQTEFGMTPDLFTQSTECTPLP
jgi:hypothetical protein